MRIGNERFAQGDLVGFLGNLAAEMNPEARMSLTASQNPYAVVVTCADSRVAPELIFDEGMGFLFVIRVAGNVMDKTALGSIDYAVAHLKPCLLLIMGHQSCGAVKAALDCHGSESAQDNIGSIVAKVLPSVDRAKRCCPHDTDPAQLLDRAVQENVFASAREIVEGSRVVEDHLLDGSLTIMTAEYYLDSGLVVEVKGQPPPPEHRHHHLREHLQFY